MEGVGRIAALKIDVEGFESHVLRGAAKTLGRRPPALIEIHPRQLPDRGSDAVAVYEQLAAFYSRIELFMEKRHRVGKWGRFLGRYSSRSPFTMIRFDEFKELVLSDDAPPQIYARCRG